MKILVVGLDCAAPELLLGDERLTNFRSLMAPTLLKLGGYDVPASMQGRSLPAGAPLRSPAQVGFTAQQEELVRSRLSGLGYLS